MENSDFLYYLAERKFGLYRSLYVVKPQAYTEEDCIERLKWKNQYVEVYNTINRLPIEYKRAVDERFEEMKEAFV